jgi:hypothetical protein
MATRPIFQRVTISLKPCSKTTKAKRRRVRRSSSTEPLDGSSFTVYSKSMLFRNRCCQSSCVTVRVVVTCAHKRLVEISRQCSWLITSLWCVAFLRDCKPTDPDYSSLDLALHLEDFGWNAKTIKQFMEEHAETPKAFREEVEEYCISAKSLWADSFMEGVTVTSEFHCYRCSFVMSWVR